MSDELYEPVELFSRSSAPKYVEGIHDDYEGFRILLRGEDLATPTLRLMFVSRPLFYRVFEECSWLMPDVPNSLIVAFSEGHWFFVVKNSKLLQWFTEVSQGTREGVRHYCICLSDKIIDVIAGEIPKADNLSAHDL